MIEDLQRQVAALSDAIGRGDPVRSVDLAEQVAAACFAWRARAAAARVGARQQAALRRLEDGLSASELRAILNFDPLTGRFTWRKKTSQRVRAGAEAGSKASDGYSVIVIAGRRYKAHRLAWLYVHGVWPEGVIDHINGDPADNRSVNLRDVGHRTNSRNRQAQVGGVYPVGQRFRAQIGVGAARVNLGTFATRESADAAYSAAKSTLHGDAVKAA